MVHSKFRRWLRCGVVCPLSLTAAIAWAQQTPAERKLAEDVAVAEGALQDASAQRKRACDDSHEADTAAVKGQTLAPDRHDELVRIATERRAVCDEQRKKEGLAQKAHVLARERAELPAKGTLQSFVEGAGTVQAELDQLEVKVNGLYDEVDKATARALALTESKDAAKTREAAELQQLANNSKSNLSAARTAANAWVKHALILKPCLIGDDAAKAECLQTRRGTYAQGEQQRLAFEVARDKVNDARRRLVDIATSIGIAAQWTNDVDRAKAADFARLLRDYPDAKSPFAEDSFQILAGTKPQATIQIVSDKLRAAGWGRFSMRLSRPLGSDQTEAELFGSADGLANGRKISIAHESVRLRGRLFGASNVLFATSLEGSVVPKDFEYYPDDASAFSAGKKKRTLTDAEFGIAFAVHEISTSNAHLVSVKQQRTNVLPKSRIRCPGGADGDLGYVNCINGPFGPPTEDSSTVVGYEYRYQDGKLGKFAATLGVQYNTHSEVVSVGVPLYLMKSADDPKRPLNAGVRVDWSSKGKQSVTGRDRNLWSWGVFVGAPFRLFSGPPSN